MREYADESKAKCDLLYRDNVAMLVDTTNMKPHHPSDFVRHCLIGLLENGRNSASFLLGVSKHGAI